MIQCPICVWKIKRHQTDGKTQTMINVFHRHVRQYHPVIIGSDVE